MNKISKVFIYLILGGKIWHNLEQRLVTGSESTYYLNMTNVFIGVFIMQSILIWVKNFCSVSGPSKFWCITGLWKLWAHPWTETASLNLLILYTNSKHLILARLPKKAISSSYIRFIQIFPEVKTWNECVNNLIPI